ncbi:MAG: hypothetical protein ACRC3Z_09135 [Phocaeicola sp.]
MKKLFKAFACFVLALSALSCTQKESQKLLLGGSGWNKIVIIDKESKLIEWEYPLEDGWECNSVAATAEGNILFSYSKGAKLIDRNHNELWNIPAPAGCEMQTARILGNGNFLLAWCGAPAVMMEVAPDGTIIRTTEYETGIANPHSQFRQVNATSKGNYLLPLFATSEIREVSPEGVLVNTVKVEGLPFSTLALESGNYLIPCGDAHSLLEVNLANGEILNRIGERDIEGVSLFFVAQVTPSSNGGYYLCNWQGHAPEGTESNNPQLIEVDAAGKMVWSLNDNHQFGMISTIAVMK